LIEAAPALGAGEPELCGVGAHGFNSACRIPILALMTSWKPTPREPAKTKAELREMLAQAVRNTQPQTESKPLPKAKKGRRVAAG